MEDIYQRIQEALRKNQVGVVLTIIAIEGSSPGRLGGKILVLQDGKTFGTIGGGRAEYLAVKEV